MASKRNVELLLSIFIACFVILGVIAVILPKYGAEIGSSRGQFFFWKTATKITMKAEILYSNASKVYIRFSGYLTDANNNPLAGKKVKFVISLDGKTEKTYYLITTNQGYFQFFSSSKYIWSTATFEGDDKYSKSSVKCTPQTGCR